MAGGTRRRCKMGAWDTRRDGISPHSLMPMDEEIPLTNTSSWGGLGLRNPRINMVSEEWGSTKSRSMKGVKALGQQPTSRISWNLQNVPGNMKDF